jgi:hypothetical protein
MKRISIHFSMALFVIWAVHPGGVQGAGASEPFAVEFSDSRMTWLVAGAVGGHRLVVSGPSGLVQQNFAAGQTPAFSVFNSEGNALPDGEYTWELRSLVNSSSVEGVVAETPQSWVRWGYVFIRDSVLTLPGEEAAEGPSRQPVQRDVVGMDDAIIIGRMCVGLDCLDGEDFNDDILRLKDEGPVLSFEDSSALSPTNDWQITINGAANKFSIDDIDGTTTPFTIEAGAPSNSFYVDDVGRLGLGTATPGAGLHLVGDSTTNADIYLESTDGSAKTWRIRNTPSNGRMTFNTVGGNVPFKFSSVAQNNLLRVGIADAGLGTSADQVNTVSIGSSNVAGGEAAAILEVFGSIRVDGATVHADYVFDPGHELPSIEDHADFMWKKSHLPSLPKAPEGLLGPVDLVTHQMGILKELETAHIYIDQLNGIVKEQEGLLETQSRMLKDLQERLQVLEGSED